MIVLIGESGSGKSTIESALVNMGYTKAISLTTRPIRPGEIDGESYYFRDIEYLQNLRSEGKIAEWIEYLGNVYALTKEECMKADVVVVEPNGLKQLQEIEGLNLEVVYLKCSEEVREARMRSRGDNKDSIQKRLDNDREHFSGLSEISDIVINVDNRSIEEITNIVECLIHNKIRHRLFGNS